MPSSNQPDRRRVLRGLGTLLALPAFECTRSWARAEVAGRAVTASGAPLRTAFLYIPNGVNVANWAPRGSGVDYQPGASFQPLAALRDHFQIVSRLKHDSAKPGDDGGGGHARANSTFLTAARPYKTAGADIRLGISPDQVVANHIQDLTRLSSLELTCAAVRTSGRCDSGYSCAYQYNLSWRSETTPMTPETDPRLVFERLFGTGRRKADRRRNLERRRAEQRSLLDYVLEDAHSLQRELGRRDRHKLDEYLTGVREVEKRIEKAERFPVPDPGVEAPTTIPSRKADYLRLMYDMLILAFQTDSTRVATLLQAHDGDNRAYNEIGISEGHHTLSHHQNRPEKLAKISRIDLWYMEQLRYFLTRMRETEDIDGKSLLHNSMIVYGGGISNGQAHSHEDLPVILAGHGGGRLRPGRHLAPSSDVPMANLYLSLFDILGLPHQERFGDSTGRLPGLG